MRLLKSYSGLVAIALILGLYTTSSAIADDADDERIVEQLAEPTDLKCEHFPLSETMNYLGDRHNIKIVLDLPELKKVGVKVNSLEVTKSTARLDDTVAEILEPFKLSFMLKDGKLLITSLAKARDWQERYSKVR